MAVETGAILDGTVAKLLKYGVIISLPEGKSGLIHISEIADEYVHQVSDYFREGDPVKVKVLGQREEGRYELSAKQAEARKPLEGAALRPANPPRSSGPEERLTDFLKESNRKINELKRSRDGKRRGRR